MRRHASAGPPTTRQPGLLITEWESVGAYRRGLGGYEVKLAATPLLAQALDQPSAFEALLRIDADGGETAAHQRPGGRTPH